MRINRENKNSQKLALIGHIRCGEMIQKGDKTFPTSLDYFKATGDYARFFHDIYGEKPSKISIIFISDNTDDSCDERRELRIGKKLIAYSDGSDIMLYNENDKNYSKTDISEIDIEKKYDGKFEEILTLKFIILGIRNVFGYWQFKTKGSQSSIPQIVNTFDAVQEMAGTVRNIPFDLIVEKVTSQKPDSKNSYPVIKLVPNICKENLDKLGSLIKSGIEMSGLITEQKLAEVPLLEEKKTYTPDQEQNMMMSLPDDIKKHFGNLKLTAGDIKAICRSHDWDNDKIRESEIPDINFLDSVKEVEERDKLTE